MADAGKSGKDAERPADQRAAYGTFPNVNTHGPRDKRCFHGKPEDWMRAQAKRTFGGKIR